MFPPPAPRAGGGAGCLLVRRNIIEALAPLWFSHGTTPGFGEDIDFCEKVAGLGSKVWMDCSLNVGHVSPRAVTSAEAFAFYPTTASGERRTIPKAFPPPLGPSVEFPNNGACNSRGLIE